MSRKGAPGTDNSLPMISLRCREISGTITAYAYETVANKPITIGSTTEMADEPQAPNPSLGMLAMGTDGLTLWRREEHTIAEA